MLAAILADRLAGRDPREIAAGFHAALAEATVEQVKQLCDKYRVELVAFSGGVFQNDLLWELLRERLGSLPKVRTLTNSALSVNDGGISLGQAAMAAVK